MQIEKDVPEALKTLNLKKTVLPVLCGLLITGFLFYRTDKITFESLALLQAPNWQYVFMVLLCIVLREIGYMARLRVLSNHALSWVSCFYVAILWEFASSVTPSVVGGGIVGIFVFSKEGLSLGRSLAYVIVNGIMDNLFFLIIGSHAFWGGYAALFDLAGELSGSVKAIFFTNYIILFIYTAIVAIGIFINPKLLQWILMRVTSIGFFKRWRSAAYQLSEDIMVTSHECMGRRSRFWIKMLLITLVSWVVRYACLNCLIATYVSTTLSEHVTVFYKQVVMWALMLLPISPGGSGVAEVLMQQFFEPMLGPYTLLITLLWRICTFYVYLILGAFFLPKWLRRVFVRTHARH